VRYYPQPAVLFISQSAEVHEAVNQLLTRLRAKLPVLAKEDRQTEGQKYVTRVYRVLQSPPNVGLPEIPTAEALAQLVQRVVAADSWKETGPSIHAAKGVLVVRQRAAVHAKIERLLGDLGAIAPHFGGGGMGGPVPVVGGIQPGGAGGMGGTAPARGGGFFAVPAK